METTPALPQPDEATLRKIALYFQMKQEVLSGRRDGDRMAERALYDDIGLNSWLDRVNKAGGVPNTMYTEPRR